MNSRRQVLNADLEVRQNKISKIAKNIKPTKDHQVIDATDQFVTPGLIQNHVHLVQMLARGYADDMKLLDWLKKRIWPMESHHTDSTIAASADIGLFEMQLLGTTTILDMGTTHRHDVIFEQVEKSGMRYIGGKCLMDLKEFSGPLFEPMEKGLRQTEQLIKKWHKKTSLLEYAICPRFAVSCSNQLLLACNDLQKQYEVYTHTHASESLEEIAIIQNRTGKKNVEYLASLGLLNPKTVIVHGVHLTKKEQNLLHKYKAPLVHCPSSNLKLASGIAPIEIYSGRITLGLGADGAPCNNTMDPFIEMRLSALLQKPKFGPEAFPAIKALELATCEGAKVIGKQEQIGSLEVGKLADIITIDRSHPSVCTIQDPYSAIVYSASGRDVKNVIIDGQIVVKNKQHQIYDLQTIQQQSKMATKKITKKMLF